MGKVNDGRTTDRQRTANKNVISMDTDSCRQDFAVTGLKFDQYDTDWKNN